MNMDTQGMFSRLLVNFYVLKNLSIPLICSWRLDETDVAATSSAIPESSIREDQCDSPLTISLQIEPVNSQIAQKAVPQALERKTVAVDADNMKRTCQTNQNSPGSRSVLFCLVWIYLKSHCNILNFLNFKNIISICSNAVFSHTHSPHDGSNECVQSSEVKNNFAILLEAS